MNKKIKWWFNILNRWERFGILVGKGRKAVMELPDKLATYLQAVIGLLPIYQEIIIIYENSSLLHAQYTSIYKYIQYEYI